MALTTYQGVIDGLRVPQYLTKANLANNIAGRWSSLWYTTGVPVAGGGGAATPGTVLTAPVTGQIPFTNPVSGESLLAQFQVAYSGNGPADLMLVDRLWHMSGISPTTLTAQTVNSAAWPARDRNQSSDGDGVYIALQASAALGAAAPTLSYTYTNSAGTGGRVANNIFATANSPGQGSTWIMGLQAGDTGVRSVQDFTLSASWISGTVNLIAFRPIAYLPNVPSAGALPMQMRQRVEDAITLCAPRIWNGSVLELWASTHGTLTTGIAAGSLVVSQG